MPVFFIQDAIKFPDLIHAVKPEPHNEIPQAASAHDTFWDFISLTPESMHMIMWAMSDRAIPRSLRNDGRFWCAHVSFDQRGGKICVREISLETHTWSSFSSLGTKRRLFRVKTLTFTAGICFEAIESGAFSGMGIRHSGR